MWFSDQFGIQPLRCVEEFLRDDMEINIVRCPECWKAFEHCIDPSPEEITCPFCKHEDELHCFPDLFY